MELFLNTAQDVTQEEVESFLALLSSDQEEFFNWLWTIIDRIEDKEKSAIIGRLFNALVKGEIKKGDFIKLTSIILSGSSDRSEIKKQLASIGLVSEQIRLEANLEKLVNPA